MIAAGRGVSVGVGIDVGAGVGVDVGVVVAAPHPCINNAMQIRLISWTGGPFKLIAMPLFRTKLGFLGKSIIAQDQAQLSCCFNGWR